MAKILLVEDNEMNRDMLSRRLLRKGYEVVMAVDGEQAVAMAQSEKPDLILMEMSLPVIDGWEATRRVKAAEMSSRIPIIALTAHAMSGDRERASAPDATTTIRSRLKCRACSKTSTRSCTSLRDNHVGSDLT